MPHGRLHRRAAVRALLSGTALATALLPTPTTSAEPPRPRPSMSLYGTTGLIDMPSAEAQPDGQVTASYSQFANTSRRNFTFQILPRLSGTLRYSTIDNWGQTDEETGIYDPSYDLYDRSFDFQLQLLDESRAGWQPSIALGFRDFLGTGVYSSEYLVASKTVAQDFTLTAGIGWGRLGGVNGFKNPFCAVSDSFCARGRDFGEGGTVSWDSFFHGEEAAAFGGVEWRATPKFTLKAEYSSDAYEREQRSVASDFERKSDFNFGAEYRWREGVTAGVYYMYGSAVGFNVVVSGNPKTPITPQDFGTGPLPVTARAADAPRSSAWGASASAREKLGEALAGVLKGEGVRLEAFDSDGTTADVVIVNSRFNRDPQAIGRTTRVLSQGLPASVETFRITQMRGGVPVTTVTVDRSAFEAQVDRPNAGARSWETTEIASAAPSLGAGAWRRSAYPDFGWSIAPQPYLYLLTPEDPIRLGLNLDATGSVQIAPGFSASAMVSQPLLNSSDDPGPSETALQPVRSDTSRYYAKYSPKLARATVDYLFKLSPSIYARTSVGYLERMFAGVSGEVLWKPSEQNWGVGLDLNYVAQRNFDNLGFDYYDYRVATGHASVYWDSGFHGLEFQVDAGRYLAGDWGGTLRVTRRFANGWAVGAYATKTDVSASDFGEGSFDKGVTLEIPFRWTVPFETRARNSLSLTSVSRDGGARLDISNRLYPIVRDLDRNRLAGNWGSFWQ